VQLSLLFDGRLWVIVGDSIKYDNGSLAIFRPVNKDTIIVDGLSIAPKLVFAAPPDEGKMLRVEKG
jgi:hypothetical protein